MRDCHLSLINCQPRLSGALSCNVHCPLVIEDRKPTLMHLKYANMYRVATNQILDLNSSTYILYLSLYPKLFCKTPRLRR